ncbi:hypothetical protein [Paraburkholderia sp. 40]|uniref:hypothetical protein n=1 Tax=Paraburkholderia sp. 40 TaxID=2991059 RepID=UPI003D1F613A
MRLYKLSSSYDDYFLRFYFSTFSRIYARYKVFFFAQLTLRHARFCNFHIIMSSLDDNAGDDVCATGAHGDPLWTSTDPARLSKRRSRHTALPEDDKSVIFA